MGLSRGSKGFLALLVVLVLAVLGGIAGLNAGGGSAAEPGGRITVEVPKGVAASQVAELLGEAGVLRSTLAFRLVAKFDERANRIKPGTYELRRGMAARDVLAVLAEGPPPPPTFKVTIPEGLTVAQTLERIAQAPDSPFTVEQLEQALRAVALPAWVPGDLPEGAEPFEGLLFPSTYEFRPDEDPQQVLGRLLRETDERLAGVTPPSGYSVYDVLIVASLIEREARDPGDRAPIASVVYNRLRRPMRLQIDATVLYARGEHVESLTHQDIRIDSLWNTYERDGLPPTPIAAPGEAAIRAAAAPPATDYLYYVVCDTSSGRHAFAATLAQHNANVARYREIEDAGGSFCP